ncbi:MAG TPA: hypothetical protein VMQ67_14645 [Candidatus Saccharimonadales bacterium]|nr:hypothetical protein [Candidatus Saccharimonadales bacterium]
MNQPACLNLSPVTWDHPWNACNFLSSITRIPALSMNCLNDSRNLQTGHEILSTGLFTIADSYSQRQQSRKLNVDAAFLRSGTQSSTTRFIPKCPAVDKFFRTSEQKTAKKAD